MPYLAMSCIFAFILSFGIGPGEWPQGSGLWDLLKEHGHLGEGWVDVNAMSPAYPHPHLYWGFWKNTKGPPLPHLGQGEGRAGQGALAGSPLSLPLLPAGVTGILATELFDQKARPAAYMVCGAIMWTMLFLVGLGFPFLMVGLPSPWGCCLRFCSCQHEKSSGRPPSKETETEGGGAYLSKEGQVPHHDLFWGLMSGG